jgi:hypothetical protein
VRVFSAAGALSIGNQAKNRLWTTFSAIRRTGVAASYAEHAEMRPDCWIGGLATEGWV